MHIRKYLLLLVFQSRSRLHFCFISHVLLLSCFLFWGNLFSCCKMPHQTESICFFFLHWSCKKAEELTSQQHKPRHHSPCWLSISEKLEYISSRASCVSKCTGCGKHNLSPVDRKMFSQREELDVWREKNGEELRKCRRRGRTGCRPSVIHWAG